MAPIDDSVFVRTCCYKIRRSRLPGKRSVSDVPSVQRDLERIRELCDTTFVGLQAALVTIPGLFVLCCIIAVFLLEYLIPLETQEHTSALQFSVNYLTGWPVLLWSFIGILTVLVTFRRPGKENDSTWVESLSYADASKASWYFCNGFFFNSMMDVFAGQLQSWPVMSERYVQLEPRYGMADTYDGVTVILTSLQEICIQAPLGLVLFYACWRNKDWRAPVEIVFNMWSVAGVLYFYGSEFILKFPHVHSPYDENKVFQWGKAFDDFDTVYKFWIGFVILPGLWVVAGVWLAIQAVQEIAATTEVRQAVEAVDGVMNSAKGSEAKFRQAQKAYMEDLKLQLKEARKQVKKLQRGAKSKAKTPAKSRTKTPKRKSAARSRRTKSQKRL